jgi:hypothetical protein
MAGSTDIRSVTPMVAHHSTPFDVDVVVTDLYRRRHPNAKFVGSVLTAGSWKPLPGSA